LDSEIDGDTFYLVESLMRAYAPTKKRKSPLLDLSMVKLPKLEMAITIDQNTINFLYIFMLWGLIATWIPANIYYGLKDRQLRQQQIEQQLRGL
jgi:hypothetical protein